jgi:hypothetical protein
MYLPKTKRQRREQPRSWIDCESLLTTTTFTSSDLLQVTPVSTSREELVWERFEKELVQKYWTKPTQLNSKNISTRTRNEWFRQRIKIGYNVCARALLQPAASTSTQKQQQQQPLLVVLPNVPQSSSLPWHYIPAVCHERNIPLFLYSDASRQLAQLLRLKQVSVMVFMSRTKEDETAISAEKMTFHQDVDSFIAFVTAKIPDLRLTPREKPEETTTTKQVS